ncbi:hypothetical protein HMI55_001832 [Coelomomyces lativittatus]|nr:hypothetical protein HMI55_001832 [Coelomomyces lativittatus]
MGPTLFELENLAHVTETEESPESRNYKNKAMQRFMKNLYNALTLASKELEKVPEETLKNFDQVFCQKENEQDLKSMEERLQTFILMMMIEDVVVSIDFIEFRKKVPDIIGEQAYDSIKLPLSIWTNEKTMQSFRGVYWLNFDASTMYSFFPMDFVSDTGIFKGPIIFKLIVLHLLPCLHDIHEIKNKALAYLSQEHLDVVAVPKCKSILMDIKSIYSNIHPFELYKVIGSVQAFTDMEHRYWQLRFLQLPQILVLEWVYFLKQPHQFIQSIKLSHGGKMNRNYNDFLKSYLAYLQYMVEQYKGM